MMAGERVHGSCMCGAVEFTAVPQVAEMYACHCEMCRRWTGSMYLSVDCGTSVEFTEGAPVSVFVSSEWGERGFCSRCGSILFWRLRDGTSTHMALNSLDNAGDYTFTKEIFIDVKPSTYNFAEPTIKQTRAEVIAQYSQQDK